MIVARIVDKAGTAIAASGSVEIDKYNIKTHGWFPIDSFSFGLQQKDKNDQGAHGAKPVALGKASGSAPAPAPGAGKGGDNQKPELTLQKLIDTATCSLMVLVMEVRGNKKGVGEKSIPLNADIHVLSSMSIEKEPERFTYTSLMIHLEAIDIKSWTIQASGDSRPTENVTLRYDRAAMVYVPTDGEHFQPHVGPKGWDQTENKRFDVEWTGWRDFLPRGS